MKKWANKYDECQNCGTTRFHHKAKGFCKRCYNLILKLDQVKRWESTNIRSLRGYPASWPYDPDLIRRTKNMFISQITKRLAYLKMKENLITDRIPVKGINIEYLLQSIATIVNYNNKNIYHGIATGVDHEFDPKQKKILYRLLNNMLENIPWRINLTEIILEK